MITANAFGSQCCSKPCTQHRISLDLFGSCLSFRGCKTSRREPPREPMVGLDAWESHPGFIITLYNTQRTTSGSTQFKMKVMESTTTPPLSPGGMLHGGVAVVVVDEGGWLWLKLSHGKRNMEKSWKWSMSLHGGDKQTKQDFGGEDDGFGNRNLNRHESLSTHTRRTTTCNTHMHTNIKCNRDSQ